MAVSGRTLKKYGRLVKPLTKSTLEEAFLAAWRQEFPRLPEPERQYPVKNPETGRDWHLDFLWRPEKLVVEIQGSGRHQRLLGQAKDYERQNYLVSQGYRCLFFNTVNLRCMVDAVTITAEVLCNSREVA